MRIPSALPLLLARLVAADCDRATLLALSQNYLSALEAGSPAALNAIAAPSGITYTLNNNVTSITSPPNALLSAPLVLDHNRTNVDTVECATYTEAISTSGPFVIATQLRFTSPSADAEPSTPFTPQLTSIDTQAATTGSWMFNATATLDFITPEDWSVLDESQQTSRDKLESVADHYLNMWMNRFSQSGVPWGSPCARTEGGNRFEPDCKVGIPTSGNVYIGDRRYVIDETKGSVQVLCAFGSLADSHEFRLVMGKLVLVHAITV